MTVTYDNILDHTGLIVKTARRYAYLAERYSNVEMEDLIQEGWLAVRAFLLFIIPGTVYGFSLMGIKG